VTRNAATKNAKSADTKIVIQDLGVLSTQ
jgi:hypothetical protein